MACTSAYSATGYGRTVPTSVYRRIAHRTGEAARAPPGLADFDRLMRHPDAMHAMLTRRMRRRTPPPPPPMRSANAPPVHACGHSRRCCPRDGSQTVHVGVSREGRCLVGSSSHRPTAPQRDGCEAHFGWGVTAPERRTAGGARALTIPRPAACRRRPEARERVRRAGRVHGDSTVQYLLSRTRAGVAAAGHLTPYSTHPPTVQVYTELYRALTSRRP